MTNQTTFTLDARDNIFLEVARSYFAFSPNAGMLQTIVTTSAEVLGNLVSFKWGKAAEALFSLRQRRVALMKGDLTSPGSEVAYIVKTRETFS
jgi:hypothetical protein